ncbi:GNAT family N-acetyltransferase [Streptomyces sp. NPDC004647]|uniref:GNAT family N-acetyltransferase n=1 Tax=Streptomyces sp. NPDC004647 TaxID=3154671 RepID=UPI0033B322E5
MTPSTPGTPGTPTPGTPGTSAPGTGAPGTPGAAGAQLTGTASPSPVCVGEARPVDTDAFLALIAAATPNDPLPPILGQILSFQPGRPRRPLSHGDMLCLVARDTAGRPVGALLGGVPKWVFEHPLCAGTVLPPKLRERVSTIHAVVVDPAHRGRGIAGKLIRAAERRLWQAGYQLLTLEHPATLTPFYEKLGYLSDEELIMMLPGADLLELEAEGLLLAVKPLSNEVKMVTVPGAPARIVSGILPGCHVSATMRFHNGRLTS